MKEEIILHSFIFTTVHTDQRSFSLKIYEHANFPLYHIYIG